MRTLLAAGFAVLLAACGGDAGLELPDGYRADALVDGLDGPTQFVHGPDGRLWVAQLGDAERSGEVVAVPTDGVGEPEVILDGLDKPTGVVFLDRALWVQLERDLARAPLDEDGTLGDLERVLTDLPYNGDSQGKLTVTLDRTLLFTTTGALVGDDIVAGSGMLWELDPEHPDAPVPYAEGFHNAQGHAVDGDGQVWATEMTEDVRDGPEELNAVVPGGDHGWPRCVGDRRPIERRGGTAEDCADTEPPVATFPAQTAPTSVAVSPWRRDELIVALAETGEVVTVDAAGGNLAEPQPLAEGFGRPQHLLVVGNQLLVGDHERGVIYRISRR